MCNFNKLNDQEKENFHLLLTQASNNIGGMNFLLSLKEAINSKKPHALMRKEMQVASNHTILKWNKIIFKDKVDLIEELVFAKKETQDKNILKNDNPKKEKNILNMVRTLSSITFTATPQNHNDGKGFTFKVFETNQDQHTTFNPLFIALFFCSTEFSKKILKYNSH
ncbi:hypothetical protein [Sulfurimonas sp.]